MASAPLQGLPLFYNDLVPLSSQLHGNWRFRPREGVSFVRDAHAVPLLVEEFIAASRHYPIVFSVGENPVPLALMGLNEGVNVFLDEKGLFPADTYVPAYIRRYPFLLARLQPNSDDLSLCFDPTNEVIGPFEDGEPLFDGTEPTQRVKDILAFCEQVEQGSLMTAGFFKDLEEQKLLTDGEFTAAPSENVQPYVYRGFRIVSEDALKNLRGDVARKWIQNGLLPLLYAHLFSLQRMGDLFGMQMQQGKVPAPGGPLIG